MTTHRIHVLCVLAALIAAPSTTVAAPPPPATSLNNCQNAVKTATKAFVTNKVAAIGTCLQAVSTQIVKNNAPDADAAAGTCVTQFRRINDSRGLDKQLSDKLAAAIVKKCAPGQSNVTHTLADIIGTGAGVPQPLNAKNLDAWCSHFGGDGALNSLQKWIDCISAAAECDGDSTIAGHYPRALEWLNLVKPSMQALSAPVADPTKMTDAVAGLDAVKAEIDGPNNDNVVSIQCGGAAVPPAQTVKTGQTTCYNTAGTVIACAGSGQDGELQTGVARAYVDNGDGTVSDTNSGLMWEKLCDQDPSGGTCPTEHDVDTAYTWTAAFTKITAMNTAVYAGHSDWRLPNINELQTLIKSGPAPTIDAVFNTSCAAPCSATACSCMQSDTYWSSSSWQLNPANGLAVFFDTGTAGTALKSSSRYARAVRGGS